MREIQGHDALDGAPHPGTLPTFTGTATNGSTLTGTNGTFTGMPTITITRQWYRLTATGTVAISGANGATYVLTAADVGSKISFGNIATSDHGKFVSYSAPSATVT
jgi:hypothetical protein